MNFKLTKEERIYKRDELQRLFKSSESFTAYPFKVVHYENSEFKEGEPALKFAVSVPKRNFKKAVDRNLLKRRCREAFRLNRNELKEKLISDKKQVLFMIIYIARAPLNYQKIEEKIILTLQRLQTIYAENSK